MFWQKIGLLKKNNLQKKNFNFYPNFSFINIFVKTCIENAHFNTQDLHSNFVDCKSFLDSNSPEILAQCETNLDDSMDSSNFPVRVYLPLIRKDSSTHTHSLAVSVKEGLLFAQDLSLEKLCRFLPIFLTGFTSVSALLLFPLSINFFVLVHGFWFYLI